MKREIRAIEVRNGDETTYVDYVRVNEKTRMQADGRFGFNQVDPSYEIEIGTFDGNEDFCLEDHYDVCLLMEKSKDIIYEDCVVVETQWNGTELVVGLFCSRPVFRGDAPQDREPPFSPEDIDVPDPKEIARKMKRYNETH